MLKGLWQDFLDTLPLLIFGCIVLANLAIVVLLINDHETIAYIIVAVNQLALYPHINPILIEEYGEYSFWYFFYGTLTYICGWMIGIPVLLYKAIPLTQFRV